VLRETIATYDATAEQPRPLPFAHIPSKTIADTAPERTAAGYMVSRRFEGRPPARQLP
jgi:hypothetical protein